MAAMQTQARHRDSKDDQFVLDGLMEFENSLWTTVTRMHMANQP